MLDAIVETAARICNASFADIVLAESGKMHIGATFGDLGRPVGEVLPLDRTSVMGRTIVDRAPVHVRDLQAEELEFPLGRQLAIRYGHRAILGVPLMRKDRALGAILLRRTAAEPFSEKQIAALRTFADQAVIAIKNVGLFEEVQARTRELQESLEYQTATSDVLGVISRSPSQLQPVLDTIVQTASELCGAEDTTILLREGHELRVAAHRGPLPLELNARRPIDRGLVTGRSVVDRTPVHVHDVIASGHEFPLGRSIAEKFGHRTTLAVPLLREAEAVGCLMLRRLVVEPFSEKQISLLQTFADQAVIAIENARLFEEVQARTRELQEALEYQTATSDVLNVISRSPSDIQPVLNTIAETAGRLCEAYDVLIRLRDGELLTGAAHRGSIAADFGPLPIGRGWAMGRAFVDRKPVHVHDLLDCRRRVP